MPGLRTEGLLMFVLLLILEVTQQNKISPMKKVTVFFALMCILPFGFSQFTAMPLDYPNNGTAYMPYFTSIVNANTVWVGTVRLGGTGYLPYAEAVKTSDGGLTWQFLPIPVPGYPWIQHVAAWDENTCYYLFTDGGAGGGSVWKTTDGGTTWIKKTNLEFQEGWANFIHLFSSDTLLVMGDPNNGYFEIQISFDAGDTWSRVPSQDIPPPLPSENGLSGEYSAVGNCIWFGTSRGRCYKSIDKGLHWTVVTVDPLTHQYVCFSDTQNGFFYQPGTTTFVYRTSDGGETWTPQPTIPGYYIGRMSRVPGINKGFVVCAGKLIPTDSTVVLYSTDFFNTYTILDSNITNTSGFINFKDETTGWLSGNYNYYHNIYKFTGVLTSAPAHFENPATTFIYPNPSFGPSRINLCKDLSGKNLKLCVFALTGELISEANIDPSSSSSTYLDASNYQNGIYFVRITQEDMPSSVIKWVVNH